MGQSTWGDNVETKGVKAHFFLDDSGILSCTTIESVFEKTISPEEQEKAEKEGDKKEGEDTEKGTIGDGEEKDSKKSGDEKKDDKEKKTKGEKYDSKEGAPKKDKK